MIYDVQKARRVQKAESEGGFLEMGHENLSRQKSIFLIIRYGIKRCLKSCSKFN
jgi:hypothetical protein